MKCCSLHSEGMRGGAVTGKLRHCPAIPLAVLVDAHQRGLPVGQELHASDSSRPRLIPHCPPAMTWEIYHCQLLPYGVWASVTPELFGSTVGEILSEGIGVPVEAALDVPGAAAVPDVEVPPCVRWA
jgi:hypothetical protein